MWLPPRGRRERVWKTLPTLRPNHWRKPRPLRRLPKLRPRARRIPVRITVPRVHVTVRITPVDIAFERGRKVNRRSDGARRRINRVTGVNRECFNFHLAVGIEMDVTTAVPNSPSHFRVALCHPEPREGPHEYFRFAGAKYPSRGRWHSLGMTSCARNLDLTARPNRAQIPSAFAARSN